jgi:exopolysaccharide biosynthesis polyprenyl glycosylphosphotransferase
MSLFDGLRGTELYFMSTPAVTQGQQTQPAPVLAQAGKTRAAVTYSRSWATALFIVDVSLFILSAYLAKLVAERFYHTPSASRLIVGDIIVITLWIVMFNTLGLYTRTYAFRMKDELYYTIAALSLGIVPQLVVFTVVPAISTSRVGAVIDLALSIVLVGTGRTVMHGIRNMRIFQRSERIAIVGKGTRIREALSSLELGKDALPLLVDVDDVDSTLSQENSSGRPALERVSWFAQAVESRCDTLIFTEMLDPRVLPGVLDVACRYHMRVAFAPPRIKRYSFSLSLETNGNQALIVARQLNACTPIARLKKRILDLGLGTLALLIFSPVMVLCAVAVYLESGRPILFRQERVGIGGKSFDVLKFRSMRVDAESETGAVWVRENDDRRTRVGAVLRRLSFDELPQLFNVLRGEMSLVGPRPERPVFEERFRQMFPRYDERHLVPPGITGWSHIHMKRLVDPSDIGERLEYDLRYVEQWTIWLDASILLKTAAEFLFHRSG